MTDSIVKKLNSSIIETDDVKKAINDYDIVKLYSRVEIKNYNKLIKHNTKRKKDLRNKHKCIIESDMEFLAPLFNKVRMYFYGTPMDKDDGFINGGVYINYLPKQAHKTVELYIINFRCSSDVRIGEQIVIFLKSYRFDAHIRT